MEINILNPYQKTVRFVGRVAKEIIFTKDENIRAKNIKTDIVSMGPTYIKIGQLISTRTDIFPDYLTNVFSDLQNGIDYMPYHEVNKIFYSDFNKDIDNYFLSFSETPIASASIGQVHLATLHSHPNHKLAVKILRKDVNINFKREMNSVIQLSLLLQKCTKPFGSNKQLDDILSIFQEQYNNIDAETNMEQELKNMMKFKSLVSSYENIVVPRVYKKLSSKNVLSMEYVPSYKITNKNLKNINRSFLATELMKSFVLMVLNDGYLHCDPHPGNVGINRKGQIVLYDFGLVKKFDLNIKEYFRKIFFALINGSSKDIIEFMLSSKIIIAKESGGTSIDMLTGHEIIMLERILQYVYVYMNNLDMFGFVESIENDKYIDVTNIPFDFDVQLVYIFKSFSTLEGVCKQLNSDFNYIDLVSNFIFDLFDIDMLIDKATYDIKKSSNSLDNNMSNDNYTKFAIEKLNKRFEQQTKLIAGVLLIPVAVDIMLFFITL